MQTRSVKGFDVYHGDAIESFHALANAEMQFGFCKASQGAAMTDPAFADYWQRMKEVGMIRGAYHFFTPDADALTQVKHFLSLVKLEPGDLPLVLDIETAGDKIGAKAFVAASEIKKQTGYWPIIYSGDSFFQANLLHYFPPAGHTLWIARYGHPPVTPCAFWQNSDAGQVPGISHAIDTNLFKGTIEQLKALCVA